MKNNQKFHNHLIGLNNNFYDLIYQLALDNLNNHRIGFIYDIAFDKFIYLGQNIKEITGISFQEYIDKDIFSLKNVIHPEDFSEAICRLHTFITKNRKQSNQQMANYLNSIILRIKHINGQWQMIKVYDLKLFYLTKDSICTLVGYICRIKNLNNNYVSLLTAREKEILNLVSNGYSTKIIANKLYISEATVITHRRHLLEKFNVRNTAQLISEAYKSQVL